MSQISRELEMFGASVIEHVKVHPSGNERQIGVQEKVSMASYDGLQIVCL